MFGFTTKKEITVGEILTFMSIIVSIIALLFSLSKDRTIQTREQANKIRVEAAKTLAKIERWKELQIWFYHEIDPIFVESSEKLSAEKNIIATRDFLWKNLYSARIKTASKILDEKLENAYLDFYAYRPEVYDILSKAIRKMKEEEDVNFRKLVQNLEIEIINTDSAAHLDQTAILGNKLRKVSNKYRESLKVKLDEISIPIRDFLVDLISKSDQEILEND